MESESKYSGRMDHFSFSDVDKKWPHDCSNAGIVDFHLDLQNFKRSILPNVSCDCSGFVLIPRRRAEVKLIIDGLFEGLIETFYSPSYLITCFGDKYSKAIPQDRLMGRLLPECSPVDSLLWSIQSDVSGCVDCNWLKNPNVKRMLDWVTLDGVYSNKYD